MKITKKNLDIIKIWMNKALEEGNSNVFDKCEEELAQLDKHIEMYSYKKFAKSLSNVKLNDLVYIPTYYKDENAIPTYYYTKGELVSICKGSKVIATYIYRNKLKGELPCVVIDNLHREYYEWFTKEVTADIYNSVVSLHVYKLLLTEEEREEVNKVLSNT